MFDTFLWLYRQSSIYNNSIIAPNIASQCCLRAEQKKLAASWISTFFFLASLGKVPKLEDDHLNSPLHKQLNHVLNQSSKLKYNLHLLKTAWH